MDLTTQWYYTKGCSRLNGELINLIGKGIGSIPLENLELGIPEEADKETLARLIRDDGVKAIVYQFSDGTDILIKLP